MSLDPQRLALERELLASLRADSAGLQQPQVRVQLHALFLEQAEALLQPLLEDVREWTAGQLARRVLPHNLDAEAAILGGVLVDTAGWRWCFYVCVPLAVIALF